MRGLSSYIFHVSSMQLLPSTSSLPPRLLLIRIAHSIFYLSSLWFGIEESQSARKTFKHHLLIIPFPSHDFDNTSPSKIYMVKSS